MIYLGAIRTQEDIASTACSANKTIPDGGDFTVRARGTVIFGVHSGDSAASNNYEAFSLGSTP